MTVKTNVCVKCEKVLVIRLQLEKGRTYTLWGTFSLQNKKGLYVFQTIIEN